MKKYHRQSRRRRRSTLRNKIKIECTKGSYEKEKTMKPTKKLTKKPTKSPTLAPKLAEALTTRPILAVSSKPTFLASNSPSISTNQS